MATVPGQRLWAVGCVRATAGKWGAQEDEGLLDGGDTLGVFPAAVIEKGDCQAAEQSCQLGEFLVGVLTGRGLVKCFQSPATSWGHNGLSPQGLAEISRDTYD